MKPELIFTNEVGTTIDALVHHNKYSSVYVLVDVNTEQFVLPQLRATSKAVSAAPVIKILSGEGAKTLQGVETIWRALSSGGATRTSALICVGGGVVTDMGGFAAATYKRGIDCINVATTLLCAVDASVGGKTGFNYNGLKNEIGVFSEPRAVVLSTCFFKTLHNSQLRSGYAEMLKHGLLDDAEMLGRLLSFDISGWQPAADDAELLSLIERNVAVKSAIVAKDFTDHGARRALNLGHTVGHALEAYALERRSPVAHGYAVAWGLVSALVLSKLLLGFPSDVLHAVAAYVREHYGAPEITCDDYPRLLELMSHDKKNDDLNTKNFTLLAGVGKPVTGRAVSDEDIKAALDITRDLLGC